MHALLNRHVVAADGLSVPVTDRGFLLADGVFDTLHVDDGVALHAADHMRRLVRHAAAIALNCPAPVADLLADIATLIAANDASSGQYALRTTLTRGSGPRGLRLPDPAAPTLLMTLAPYTPPNAHGPFTVCIARTTRRNSHSPLSRIKALAYGDAILAMQEAVGKGCDDAILLNGEGAITCGTASTVLVETPEGQLFTPKLDDGVLDGITRADLIATGRCVEKTLYEQDVMAASTVYLCNSLMGMRKVTKLVV